MPISATKTPKEDSSRGGEKAMVVTPCSELAAECHTESEVQGTSNDELSFDFFPHTHESPQGNLKLKVSALTEKVASLEAANAKLMEEVLYWKKQAGSMNVALIKQVQQLNGMMDKERQEAKKKIDSLQADLSASLCQNVYLKTEVHYAKRNRETEVNRLKQQVQSLQKAIDTTKSQLTEKDGEIATIKKTKQQLQKQAKEAKTKMEKVEAEAEAKANADKCLKLESQEVAMKQEIQVLTDANSQLSLRLGPISRQDVILVAEVLHFLGENRTKGESLLSKLDERAQSLEAHLNSLEDGVESVAGLRLQCTSMLFSVALRMLAEPIRHHSDLIFWCAYLLRLWSSANDGITFFRNFRREIKKWMRKHKIYILAEAPSGTQENAPESQVS